MNIDEVKGFSSGAKLSSWTAVRSAGRNEPVETPGLARAGTSARCPSEHALLERSRRGDTAAFDQLVRGYRPRLVAALSGYLRNPADAQDVVQDALLRAYRFLHTFRDASAFSSWLYRIAFNSANDHLARKRRRRESSFDALDMESVNETDALTSHRGPECLVSEAQTEKGVREAIDRLPKPLKAAIELRVFEGQTYDQIAGAMDCPIGTVRSRIFRARRALYNEFAFTQGG